MYSQFTGSCYNQFQHSFAQSTFLQHMHKSRPTITSPTPLNPMQVHHVLSIISTPTFRILTDQFVGRYMKQLHLELNGSPSKDEMNMSLVHWNSQIKNFARPWILGFGIVPYRIIKNGRNGLSIPSICSISEIQDSLSNIYVCRNFRSNPPRNEYYWTNTMMPKSYLRRHTEFSDFMYDPKVYFFRVPGKEPSASGMLYSNLSTFIQNHKEYQIYRRISMEREHLKLYYPGFLEEQVPTAPEQIEMFERIHQLQIGNVGRATDRVIDTMQDPRIGAIEPTASTFYLQEQKRVGLSRNLKSFAADQKLIKLEPMEKYRERRLQPMEISMLDMAHKYESTMAAGLGMAKNPWTVQGQRAMSDGEIIITQSFTALASSVEMAYNKKLVTEWYFRIYGHPLWRALLLKDLLNSANKGPRESNYLMSHVERLTEDNKRALRHRRQLTDAELEIILRNSEIEMEVNFDAVPFIARPNIDKLDEHFMAGAIDKETYWQAQENVFGVRHKPVSAEQLRKGKVLVTGITPEMQTKQIIPPKTQNPNQSNRISTKPRSVQK